MFIMKECYKDCLSCSNSFSISSEEAKSGTDELFCIIKQEIVQENNCCEEYN